MTFKNILLFSTVFCTGSLLLVMFVVFKPMYGDESYIESYLMLGKTNNTQPIDPGILQQTVKLQIESNANADAQAGVASAGASGQAQAFLDLAISQLGKPYQWGAVGENSFDCSGLVYYCYNKITGTSDCPRATYGQATFGQPVDPADIQPGDIIIMHADQHHVVIYAGNDQVIHSPQTGDVVKYSSYSGWAKPNTNTIRRLF